MEIQRYTSLRLLGAAALIALQACGSDSGSDNDDTLPENGLVLTFTSDYTTGELRWMPVDSAALSAGSMEFSQDSKLAAHEGTLFVLERTVADNLNCVDLTGIGKSEAVKQVALEKGANPADAAVTSNGNGWLALNSTAYVQKFNPENCQLSDKVDLSAYKQKGEIGPHASAVIADGNTVLVLLQRLQTREMTSWGYTFMGLYPNQPGLLVRLNAASGAVIDTISLHFHNPASAILDQGRLYVASSGDNVMNIGSKGGLEVVDLKTGKSTILADSAALGGGANYIALDSDKGVVYTTVNISYGNNPVKPFILSTKTVGAAIPDANDAFGELAFDDISGRLFIGDRTMEKESLLIYDGAQTTKVRSADALPPYDVLIARW